MKKTLLSLADSYKYSHSSQYPDGTTSIYEYMESRGGLYPATVFVGLQYYIKEYLLNMPSHDDVYFISDIAARHGVPFDLDGWNHIVSLGHYPIKINAVAEGSLIPNHNVLMTIESTDPKVPWLAGFVETLLMKIWYPTTIATKSYYVRKMLEKYGSAEWAQFAYHNFGDRGSSSVESAAIGGFAHSTQFLGTDNFNSLLFAKDYYDSDVESYSVFATEHSTTTSHGKENEEDFVYSMLTKNPDKAIMSFVADSYDVYKFTHFCTDRSGRIRKLIDSRENQKLVIRPDSGEPIEVLSGIIKIMRENHCGSSKQDNKYYLNNYAILWGDGITPDVIESILIEADRLHFAAENFVFGSGGDIMQNVTRDTQRFAIKCSSITVDGEDRDVFKNPSTDSSKASKKGKVSTFFDESTNTYETKQINSINEKPILNTVFKNGVLLQEASLRDIRRLSK